MEKLKGLAIELDMDHLSVDRGLKGLKDNIRTVNSEMRRNMSAFDRSDRSVAKYETSLMGLNKKLEVQKVAVAEAKKEYEAMVDEYGHGSKEAEKAAREYNNQAASLNNLERYIERTKDELVKFQREQRISNSTWTKMGDKLESYGGKLKGIGGKMNDVGSKMTKRITMPAFAAATAVGGIFSAFGWGRLVSLDNAQAKLKGLGYTMEDVERITLDVKEAVTGTTMTMAEGTDVAAGGLAAGVKEGKELEEYIRRVGNAAVGANRPIDDMAMIFNRVQGAGKLMTQELNSIEAGMPGFSKAMSKHLGVSTEKFREMVTDGKVSSKDFMKVMDDFAGDMAKEYAKTWDGMVSNTKANIGIIGESFLKGVFQDGKKSLADFIELLKSPEIKRRAEEMGEVARKSFGKMKDSIVNVVNWYKDLDDGQKTMIKRLGLVAVAGGPVLQAVGKLTSGFGGMLSAVGKLSKAIGLSKGVGLLGALSSLGPVAAAAVAVAGLTAVGVAVYDNYKKMKEGEEGTVEYAKAQRKLAEEKQKDVEASKEQLEKANAQIESYFDEKERVDELVDSYGGLIEKSELTNSEMGELLRLQEELSLSKSPKTIENLSEKIGELEGKTGLSKDELSKLYGVSNELNDFLPNATHTVDEHGDAYANAADDVRKLMDAEFEYKRGELLENIAEQQEIISREAENYASIVEGNLKLKGEVNDLAREEAELREEVGSLREDEEAQIELINDLEKEKKDLLADGRRAEAYALGEEEQAEREILRIMSKKTEEKQKELEDVREVAGEKEKELTINEKTLGVIEDALDGTIETYNTTVDHIEAQTELNLKAGEELDIIDSKISKNNEDIKTLEKKKKEHGANKEEIDKQIKALEDENGILEENKDILAPIVELAELFGGNIEDVNKALDDTNKEWINMSEKEKEATSKAEIFESKLNDITDETKKGVDAQEKQGDQIDDNNKKTDKGIEKEKARTKEAGKGVSKNVDVLGLAAAREISDEAARGVAKSVTINAIAGSSFGALGSLIPGFAKGTPPSGHSGGPAIIGEEGSELVKLPSGRSFVSPNSHTLLDLPKGTHVIPHRKTKRILKGFPRYADGTSGWMNALGNSEFARLLMMNNKSEAKVVVHGKSENNDNSLVRSLLNASLKQNEILMQLLQKNTILVVNDRVLATEVEPHITEIQERNKEIIRSFERKR